MLDMINRLADILLREQANKVVLQDNTQSLTGKELFYKASQLAQFFLIQGAARSDKIAIQLPNCIDYILCYFAGIIGNFTIIPINSALPEKDINYILSITQPKLHIKTVAELAFPEINLDHKIHSINTSIIAIFFTSGTTNKPKGVCHTTENMLANAHAFNQLVGLDQDTRLLHVMPMGYMAGFLNTVLSPILAGGSIVIAPQFSAAEAMNFWKPVMDHAVNAMWITPTMAALLARLNRNTAVSAWTKQHLRHVFVGTAPLPKSTKQVFDTAFGVECLESYGMTEVMLVSANAHKFVKKDGAVGRLIEQVEVQARNAEGHPLSINQEGDLYLKSPFALQGYLNPETGEMISPLENGWLATGDYGYVDPDHDLFITGRIKDLIIRGGTNVSPRAVEEVLLLHPDIQEAAVIGKPHAFWGEEVVAFIIMNESKAFNQALIAEHCRQNLHADAFPSLFKLMNELPRSSTGKIQTHKLRELL